jgi:hypothetical protein
VSAHYIRFSARGARDRLRSVLLERLVARADVVSPVGDWRGEAFRLIAPQEQSIPGLAATALCADRGAVAGAWVLFATPVNYLAEMSNVRLAADGILSLDEAQRQTLCVDFNRVWHDAGIRLTAARSGELFCLVDQPLPASTHDPEDARDQHIHDFQPSGPGSPRLRQLMSEIEMWLFDHPVNRSRTAAALPAVNGLWLWGGGAPLNFLPPVQGWTAGNDPFFRSFAATRRESGSSGVIVVADEPGAGASASESPSPGPSSGEGTGSGVIVVAEEPGTAGWRDVETRWIQPALRQLRSGRISGLHLSAGHRCISVGRRWGLRFWRRARPWWESFA